MLAYYAGLLSSIKSEFSDLNKFKEFGYIIHEFMTFPFSSSPNGTMQWKAGLMKEFMKFYADIYPHLDLTMDRNVIIEEDIYDDGNSAIIRLKNLKVFDISENFDIHYYIISGIMEKAFSKSLKREVNCNVKKIDASDKIVEISIEIKNK